jgi:hypothetical protein
MNRMNILNKEGFLTDEERKEPLEYGAEYMTFKTCLDLSEPIQMRLYGNAGMISANDYSNDIAIFISYWDYFVKKDLNGFSGFHNVKWERIDFEIVN